MVTTRPNGCVLPAPRSLRTGRTSGTSAEDAFGPWPITTSVAMEAPWVGVQNGMGAGPDFKVDIFSRTGITIVAGEEARGRDWDLQRQGTLNNVHNPITLDGAGRTEDSRVGQLQ